jgi:hypothetical protein
MKNLFIYLFMDNKVKCVQSFNHKNHSIVSINEKKKMYS